MVSNKLSLANLNNLLDISKFLSIKILVTSLLIYNNNKLQSPKGSLVRFVFNHKCWSWLRTRDLNHELLEVLRTRIVRITRMSPLGSAACVSCVKGLSKKIRLIREICVHIKAKSSCSFKSERDIHNNAKKSHALTTCDFIIIE